MLVLPTPEGPDSQSVSPRPRAKLGRSVAVKGHHGAALMDNRLSSGAPSCADEEQSVLPALLPPINNGESSTSASRADAPGGSAAGIRRRRALSG